MSSRSRSSSTAGAWCRRALASAGGQAGVTHARARSERRDPVPARARLCVRVRIRALTPGCGATPRSASLAMGAWLGCVAQAITTQKGAYTNLIEHRADAIHNNLISAEYAPWF